MVRSCLIGQRSAPTLARPLTCKRAINSSSRCSFYPGTLSEITQGEEKLVAPVFVSMHSCQIGGTSWKEQKKKKRLFLRKASVGF